MSTGRHVLIVEDDAPTRTLLAAVLRRGDVETTLAADGAQAIARLTERRFDLVILDLMMPQVGGLDVINFLRGLPRRPPVIVCTAAGPNMTGSLPWDIVTTVLRKPFDLLDLMGKVNELTLSSSEPIPLPRVLIVDDDRDARYVIRSMTGEADIVEAASGEEALALVREQRPDVILLDLRMPAMSGSELLAHLEKDPETAGIPVVIVTSHKLSEGERLPLLQYSAAYVYKGDLSRERLSEAMRLVLKTP